MSNAYRELYTEDLPSESPEFGFPLVAKALVPLVTQKTKGAVVLGIHGPWGSGKTTLMCSLRGELGRSPEKHNYVFIDFNAWKFQDKQALWRALILHTLGQLRARAKADAADNAHDGKKLKAIAETEKKLDELEQALYRTFAVEEKGPWKLNWRSLFTEVIGLLLSAIKLEFVGTALKASTGWFSRLFFGDKDKNEEGALVTKERVDQLAKVFERTTIERNIQQVQSVEQFLDEFKKLAEGLTQDGRRVFVFIDDLDRCLPESALEIFEAIKLFLDAPGFAYVVALDRDVIRKALDVKYSRGDLAQGQRFISADQYIEKTISVSFDAPRLSAEDALAIVGGATLPLPLSAANRELIIKGLGTNPRRVKRFMNTLALHLNLARVAKEAGLPVHPGLLGGGNADDLNLFIKLLIISYRYSGVFSLALDDERLLERLQEVSNRYESKVDNNKAQEGREERNEALKDEPTLVSALRYDEEFWALMRTPPRLTTSADTVRQLRNWFRAGAQTPGQ